MNVPHSHLINQFYARGRDIYTAYMIMGSNLAAGEFKSTPITIDAKSMPRYCGICEKLFVTHHLPAHPACIIEIPGCKSIYLCGICSSVIRINHHKIITHDATITVASGPSIKYQTCQALASLRFYGVATISSGDNDKLCYGCSCSVSHDSINVTINYELPTTICERCFNKSNRELAKIYRKCPNIMQLNDFIKHEDIFSAIINVVITIGLV